MNENKNNNYNKNSIDTDTASIALYMLSLQIQTFPLIIMSFGDVQILSISTVISGLCRKMATSK